MKAAICAFEELGLGDDLPVHVQITHVVDDDTEIEIPLVSLKDQTPEQSGLSRTEEAIQYQNRNPPVGNGSGVFDHHESPFA